MRRPASLRRAQSRTAWLFALTVVGYPIFGLLASLMDVDSTVTSLPFRIGVLALTLALWRRSPPLRTWLREHPWLPVFWGLYLLRLVWDLLIGGQPSVPEAMSFFVLTVLLPCLVLGLNAAHYDDRRAARLIVLVGGAVCFTAVTMHVFKLGQARSLGEITTRMFFEALNPISLGHAAVSTLIAALCVTRQRPAPPTLMAAVATAIAAGVCLVLSGSRGPTLALGVCALLFVAATGRVGWLALIAILVVPQALNPEGELFLRFAVTGEDNSALERLLVQANAIQQFLARPLLGSAYVELEFKDYPHNLILETAIALGVVGLGVLIAILARSAKIGLRQLRDGQLLLPLLFVQYFVAAQFSGAIWGNSALWAAAALLVASRVPTRIRRRPRENAQPLPAAPTAKLASSSQSPAP